MKWHLTPLPQPSHSLDRWIAEVARHHGFSNINHFLMTCDLGHEDRESLVYRRFSDTLRIIAEQSGLPVYLLREMTLDAGKIAMELGCGPSPRDKIRVVLLDEAKIDYDLKFFKNNRVIHCKLFQNLSPDNLFSLLSNVVDVHQYELEICNYAKIMRSSFDLLDFSSPFILSGGGVSLSGSNICIQNRGQFLAYKYVSMVNWISKITNKDDVRFSNHRCRKPINPDKIELFSRYRAQGYTIQEAAESAKISQTTAYKYLRLQK